ncbi:MAG: hypothetical protein QY323_00860 [Patescibacteria group bacterium]|nr:MAG: hypothetical protein QY323_00860 [Patescibacteria group bacterium]
MPTIPFEAFALFLFLAGFVIGLGAVTVIDLHGFLGRKSGYWTEATTRTHKVTKPMIWAGMLLATLGGALYYREDPGGWIPRAHALIAAVLVVNGLFLSFRVSPFLLKREREGRSAELLPSAWQKNIMVSLIVSDLGWWSALFLLSYRLVTRA